MEPNQYGTENGITSGIIGIVETLSHIQNDKFEFSEKYLVFRVAVPATRGGRGRGPPVRGPCPGVGRGDVGGGAGRPRLAAVAVLAAGPVLLLGKDGLKILCSQVRVDY